MADNLITTTTTEPTTKKQPQFDGSLFTKRIEFHPSRKPFTGFSKGSSDFHLETLNSTNTTISPKKPIGGYSSSSSSPTSAGKRQDGGEDLLEQHGLDPELSFGITFGRIGAGLENLGNTCFLNSVLQCLTYTEPFAAYLQSGKHKSSCHMAGFCALCAIQNHVKRALQSTGRILAPKDLVMNLRCISRSFRNARQEDAHEYMVNLLESMHKCCLPSGVPSESPSAYEKSLVHKIFGGRLRSQVKCMQCSHCSNTFDPFLDLSLEIVQADSLHKALAHFTATEQLDGGQRQYQCDRCKQKVKALKQLTVHKAPYVLTIHLKRFSSYIPGQKIDKKVEFGPTLDLKPFVSGSYEGELKYTLYGVLVHAGWSTHSGHYYCFVRTSSGMWHSLDDNRVVQVSERTVLEQKAYMLFYVRDRKNLAPRKSLDVISKENVVPSAIGNKGQTASFPNKAIQNGPTARVLTACSSGVAKIDASGGSPLKKPQSKEVAVVKAAKDLVRADGSALMKESQSELPLKEPENGTATICQFVAEGCPQAAPSSDKITFSNLWPMSGNDGGAKFSAEKGKQGSKNDARVVIVAPCEIMDCSGSQSLGPEKLVIDKAIQKVGVVNKGTIMEEVSRETASDLKNEKSSSAKSLNPAGLENDQKEGTRSPSKKVHQRADENGLEIGSAETSKQLNLGNGFVKKDTVDRLHNHKKVLKAKKKLMKHQIASMYLGSKFFFRASLILSRKKKHKRNKRRSVELKKDVEDNLEEVSNLGGLGPSTSEKTRVTALVSNHSKKPGKKKGAGHRTAKFVTDSNVDSVTNGIELHLGERIHQNNAMLSTSEPLEMCSGSGLAVKQWDMKEPGKPQDKRDPSENGLTNILSKVLGQSTVSCWDGIESCRSSNLGSSDGQSNSIGYVPDEWDQVYDEGKRRKVRNRRNMFGGPNVFQQAATSKVHSKKAKMDTARSGNRPYRI